MSINYKTYASVLDTSALSLREDLLKQQYYYTDLLECAYYHKHKKVGKLVKKRVDEYKPIIYIEPSEPTLLNDLVPPNKMKAWGFLSIM